MHSCQIKMEIATSDREGGCVQGTEEGGCVQGTENSDHDNQTHTTSYIAMHS